MGNGWMPLYTEPGEARPGLALLAEELALAGRSREEIGLEGRLPYGKGDPNEWQRLLEGWFEVGASHISLVTTGCGLRTPGEHMDAMRRFAKIMAISQE